MKRKTLKKKNKGPTFYATFIGDIDNFIGVDKIRNYFISSMRDDSYKLGLNSVGVMQLHNKLNGQNISK